MVHMRHGGEYLDENPITGRPGEFHLTSTGRKPVLPPPEKQAPGGLGSMNGLGTNAKTESKKEGRTEKSPKSGGMPKLKRKKSKMGGRTPAAST